LNKFAISGSGSGLTPLTCKIQQSYYKFATKIRIIIKFVDDIQTLRNAEYIPLLEASKVVQEVISIEGKTLQQLQI